MGIQQVDPNKNGLLGLPSNNKDHDAPKIPPRMKKQGPEIPEKPPHLRLTTLTKRVSVISSQNAVGQESSALETSLCGEQSQKLFLTNVRKKAAGSDREILVAATKGARDRPVEKRQREPAKLLTPLLKSSHELDDTASLQTLLGLSSPESQRKDALRTTNPRQDSYRRTQTKIVQAKPSTNSRQPLILIPRSQLDTRNIQRFYNSYPMSYSVWVQNSGSGDPQVTSRLIRRAFSPNGTSTVELRPNISNTKASKKTGKEQQETKIFVSGKKSSPSFGSKQRSSSVTRSGSLTSHGSTSSDSGNETFPKSVLKKHKRETTATLTDKKTADHKKNVTFNAFATVQLMEE